ncbi:hypothetical protein Nepgr_012919 [Nepenthes gracilis]|uniref:RPN1 N-terminal domain-containing protein n=1 Tax=Nepenthes gracilis TaxID=150966 RepID=A0AAD3SGU6_NEPGR|nr:hypothetical protein Nepgr_012919 [Nepenthes gracilis]
MKYRLLGSAGDIGSWGHEYVRNLAGETAQEFAKRQNEEAPMEDLMDLVQQIVKFHIRHNAEPEAVDLLLEVEDLDLLVKHVDIANCKRTCLNLTAAARCLKLTPVLGDPKAPLNVNVFMAISLGLVYVGSCNEEVALAIIFSLMDRSDDCTRSCAFGKGLVEFQSISIRSLLIITDGPCWTCNNAARLSQYESHYLGEISLCALLPLAMQPRMLITLDENSKPLSVPVWVGQAVDVVHQAELATEKYIRLPPILDGFFTLKENLDYRDEH